MAAPGNGKYFQYVNPGATGSRSSGEVFNIRDGQLPAALGVLSHPDGDSGLSAQIRVYDESGRYIYYRPCGTAGTFNGEQMWAYYFVHNPSSVNAKREIRRISGSASAGNIRVIWLDQYTDPIPWVGLTAAKLQALMEKHPSIGPGNIKVTYTAAGSHSSGKDTYTFEWIGNLAHLNMPAGFGVRNETVGNLQLQAFNTQNGTSDFPDHQCRWTWDIVGFKSGRFSGDVGSRKDATASARCVLWADYPAGLTSMSPADGATVTTIRPSINWAPQSGTIGAITMTSHTIEYFENNGGVVDDDPVIQYTKSGASVTSFVQFNHLANTQLKDNQAYVRRHTLVKASGIVTVLEYDMITDQARPAAPPAPTWQVQTDNVWVTVVLSAPTALAANVFIEHVFKVRPQGAAEEGPDNVEILTSTSRTATLFRLFKVPKARDVTIGYYVRQYQFGVPTLSLAREFNVNLNIASAVVVNPRTREYIMVDAHLGLDSGYNEEPFLQSSWARKAPVAIFGHQNSRSVEVTMKARGSFADMETQYRTLESLYINQYAAVLVYSDTTGDVFDCVLGKIRKFIPGGGQAYQYTIPVREVGNNSVVGT